MEPAIRRYPRSPPPPRRAHSRDLPAGFARRGGGRNPSTARTVRLSQLEERSDDLRESLGRIRALYTPRFDGLGDRDRSLSPEGDGAWDTLLSTLTPDPQPPSVGSSFASASASAAASQGAATGSTGTSLTGPDTTEDSAFEHPCESGGENSDTEGDDDEEMEENALTRFPPALRRGRSYADVAAPAVSQGSSNDDSPGFLRGIEGMQRIVRNLARREDIPDEWWAEAGLSRTLSREGSS